MFFLIVCLAVVAAVTAATDPVTSAPRWGGNSTSSKWQALVSITDITTGTDGPSWMFRYYFDAESKASRFEHFVGDHVQACHLPGRDARGPCTILSAENGRLYVAWAPFGRHRETCCQCGEGSAPDVKSDWFSELGGGAYRGRTVIDGVEADEWARYGQADDHYFVTADGTQAPLRFVENKNGKVLRWDFQRWLPEIPWSGLFEQQSECPGECPSELCAYASDEVLL